MSGAFQNIFQFFFLGGYVILFIISFIILRPFRVHKQRKISTISLKTSYILFLASFLTFTYLLLFGKKVILEDHAPYDSLFNVHFLFFLTSMIVPNVGIMVRKRVKKNRVNFNVYFTLINFLYASYLTYLVTSGMWSLL